MGLSNYLPNSRINQPGVCTSSTRPVSPYEGFVIYETDTDRVLVWNNSAWVDPSTGRAEKGGIVFIKSVSLTTVTNNVSDVFSSTYDSYRVVISDLNNSTTTTRTIYIRFRTTSDDSSTAYYWGSYYIYGAGVAGSGGGTGVNAASLFDLSGSTAGVNSGNATTFDIVNPNLAKATQYYGHSSTFQSSPGHYVLRHIFGGVNTATQYTGFSIIGTTDNLSGTVRVYGYNQ
jgi:hypothetical protein